MISYLFYGLYNVLYQGFILGILFYANTFFNANLIPDSFRWTNGKLREDTIYLTIAQSFILVVEAALLILLIYYFNKWFLGSITKSHNTHSIATWTAAAHLVITLIFIIYFIYVISK